MEKTIKRILKAQGLLEKFEAGDAYAKIEVPGYMPLSIERQGSRWIVSHTYIQNGDLMSDPVMDFDTNPDDPFCLPWQPMTFQNDGVGLYQEAIFCQDGKKMVRPKLLRQLKSFCRMWGRNLIAQGFATK